jgi:hypothetical protein
MASFGNDGPAAHDQWFVNLVRSRLFTETTFLYGGLGPRHNIIIDEDVRFYGQRVAGLDH